MFAERALVLLLEPRLDALRVENMPDIAGQGCDHSLLWIFRILLEFFKTNGALNTERENIWMVSLLYEAVSEHGQAFLLFDPLPCHLAVHVDEDWNEQEDEEAHEKDVGCRDETKHDCDFVVEE